MRLSLGVGEFLKEIQLGHVRPTNVGAAGQRSMEGRGRVKRHKKNNQKTSCLQVKQFKKSFIEISPNVNPNRGPLTLTQVICGKSCLSFNFLPSFALRVSPGWQTRCFSWHSTPVLIIRLRELKRSVGPAWIIHLHGACFPSNSVTCNPTSSGPYSPTPAPPSSSNCIAVEQCQCGHGKNQWR